MNEEDTDGWMTWDQFKAYIDKELEKLGVDGSYKIDWIDIGLPRYDDTNMNINRETRTMSVWG